MKRNILLILFLVTALTGCSVFQQIRDFSKLKFKIGSVSNFVAGGIDISSKTSYSDFGALELLKLTSLFAENKLPVSFTLNIEAKNPNKSNDNSNASSLSLKSLPWTLYINDKETISGNIKNPVAVPANNSVIIPLNIQIDFIKFFDEGNLQSLTKLILKLGGANNDLTKIKIVVQPVIGTRVGDMTYPEKLTIINSEFK